MAANVFANSPIPAVNVACVPQRSPLRYPGGKTWLIPHIRYWLTGRIGARLSAGGVAASQSDAHNSRQRRLQGLVDARAQTSSTAHAAAKPELLVEPFAAGGIVSLTAVMEGMVERCMLAELDEDVSAFWQAALRCGASLQSRVRRFQPTRDAVNALASTVPAGVLDRGFRTLVLNRTRRGGILAAGASLSRRGENGKGVASRWYPETTIRRLAEIERHAPRIDFRKTDGLGLLASLASASCAPSESPLASGNRAEAAASQEALVSSNGQSPTTTMERKGRPLGARPLSEVVAFVDPPYTAAGGKRAGSRLYRHYEVDHAKLFGILANSSVDFLMTYDCAPEIVSLIKEHGFHAVRVAMKNTHHAKLPELVITRRSVFNHAQ